MCYGWEPDDIVQIIVDIKKCNKEALETIDKALMKGDACCIHHYFEE